MVEAEHLDESLDGADDGWSGTDPGNPGASSESPVPFPDLPDVGGGGKVDPGDPVGPVWSSGGDPGGGVITGATVKPDFVKSSVDVKVEGSPMTTLTELTENSHGGTSPNYGSDPGGEETGGEEGGGEEGGGSEDGGGGATAPPQEKPLSDDGDPTEVPFDPVLDPVELPPETVDPLAEPASFESDSAADLDAGFDPVDPVDESAGFDVDLG